MNTPENSKPILYLTRKYEFCASHRLFNPMFSDEENTRIFRECASPNGHGHNYELEVTVQGSPADRTGMIVDMWQLDQIVQQHLLKKVDHKHLNLDVEFLRDVIPTAENIVYACWRQLAPHIPPEARLSRLRLLETRNNFAEYRGE